MYLKSFQYVIRILCHHETLVDIMTFSILKMIPFIVIVFVQTISSTFANFKSSVLNKILHLPWSKLSPHSTHIQVELIFN
jgi:flagellar biosynthesis protein FlhB